MKRTPLNKGLNIDDHENLTSVTDHEDFDLIEEKEEKSEDEELFLEVSDIHTGPLPRTQWIVTRSFQMAFWHCLYYCRHALPVRILYMVYTIQQLGAASCLDIENDWKAENLARKSDDVGEEMRRYVEKHRFLICDSTELLLRLALRKSTSFSHKYLEKCYGERMKIDQVLCILEKAQFAKIDWSSSSSSHPDLIGQEKSTCIPNMDCNQQLLSTYIGETIASLIWDRGSAKEKKKIFDEDRETLITILSAVTSHDLRRVAAEMYRFCRSQKDSATSFSRKKSIKEPFSALEMALPTRKRDIISYLIHQKYASFVLETNCAERQRVSEELRKKFIAVWNASLGKVYVIHPEVKFSVEFVSRLFHVITSNFSGLPIRTDKYRHSLETSTIAESPGSLFHYYQQYVLDSQCKGFAGFPVIQALGEQTKKSKFAEDKFFSWSTFSRESSSQQRVVSSLQLFSSTKELERYWKALQFHVTLYHITDGAANFAKKLLGRDLNYVMPIFQSVMEFLSSFHDSCNVGAPEYAIMQERYGTASEHREDKKSGYPIYFFLYKDGLLAAHLLQFTPQYRLYACLELLFPLLESLGRYQEAVSCLEVLLFRPLFVLYSLSSQMTTLDIKSDTQTTFPIKYRSEKRGHWLYRLGVNLSHLKQWERGLELLKTDHKKWEELRALSAEERQYLLESSSTVFLKADGTGGVSFGQTKKMFCKSSTSSLHSIERRGRMLRALWPQHVIFTMDLNDCAKSNSSKANASVWKAQYHGVMEFIFDRYCHRPDRLAIETLLENLHKKIYRWTPLKPIWQHNLSLIRHPPVLFVKGIRDPHDSKAWKNQGNGMDNYTNVEQMVLSHFLRQYNGESTPKREINQQEEVNTAQLDPELQDITSKSEWNGLHCEGQWISMVAEILLRECFYADVGVPRSTGETENSSKPTTHPAGSSCSYVWLSRFQNGPLDLINPLIFSHRRRRMIENRLDYLETASDEEFQHVIASSCYRKISESDPLEDAEKDSTNIFTKIGKGTDQEGDRGMTDSSESSGCLTPFRKVYLNDFPVLEIISSIPRKSLITLLRCMFLDSLFDGFSYSTSGFPDLILWKSAFPSKSAEAKQSTCFQLMEVKSPNDTLSTKQIAVNDALLRCGFDVYVVKVYESR